VQDGEKRSESQQQRTLQNAIVLNLLFIALTNINQNDGLAVFQSVTMVCCISIVFIYLLAKLALLATMSSSRMASSDVLRGTIKIHVSRSTLNSILLISISFSLIGCLHSKNQQNGLLKDTFYSTVYSGLHTSIRS